MIRATPISPAPSVADEPRVIQSNATGRALAALDPFFASRSWRPFDFQTQSWAAYLAGKSGLIHAPTGLGKTIAAYLGPVAERLIEGPPLPVNSGPDVPSGQSARGRRAKLSPRDSFEPLRILWVTPLRALASDTAASLSDPLESLGLNTHWNVEIRTGDTPQSLKLKQRERLPTVLVTTPESLSLLMSYPDSRERLSTLRCAVVDEWHELMGSKRGVQVELALARLRSWNPGVRTWGMSATLGNLAEAMQTLVGLEAPLASLDDEPRAHGRGVLIQSGLSKRVELRTLVPDDIERFTWAGHLGSQLAPKVLAAVDNPEAQSTLLFCNTRSQAEIWFKRFLDERPDLLGHVAIHHGSLDRDLRSRVESMLDDGRLRCVVCTSSLDLGIDFRPVDQVIQLGSPKGVARLLQRAGRSGHRPGAISRVIGVPTNAFELVEFAALREQIERANAEGSAANIVEARRPLDRPMDVLVQHLVTCAIGGGFFEDDLKREVRTTRSFMRLADGEWNWAMDFVRRGGEALKAYPQYEKIHKDETQGGSEGKYVGVSEKAAKLHRMTIGTIASSAMMNVKYTTGQFIGTIEEQFISRLEVGSRFILAGRILELVRVRDMTAWTRRATSREGIIPRWDGGRMSLSTHLAAAVRTKLDEARRGVYAGEEMQAARPLLELQKRWSILPAPDELLIEMIEPGRASAPPKLPARKFGPARHRGTPAEGSGGHHAFLYLFEGRQVHEGLGALLSYRLTKRRTITVVSTSTDQGVSFASPDPLDLDERDWRELLSSDNLLSDLMACVNSSVLARRQFRDIARVAGLIVTGYPGSGKPMRQLQASSEMFFSVLQEFDAGNLLLDQARREVLDAQLEVRRIREALERAAAQKLQLITLHNLSPLAFPIWAETLRSLQLSSERWSDLVKKMSLRLEESASE